MRTSSLLPLTSNNDEEIEIVTHEQCVIEGVTEEELLAFKAYMKDILKIDFNNSHASEMVRENYWRRRSRQLIQAGAMMFGATAGAPYVPVALEAGKGYDPLGYFASVSTVVAYGAATMWIMHKLVDRLTPTSIIEGKITYSKVLPLYRHVLSNFLGIATSSSTIYIMSRYTKSPLLIGMAFLTDYGYKTQGYYQLMDFIDNSIFRSSKRFLRRNTLSNETNTVLNTARIIKENLIPFLLAHPEEIKNFFSWDDTVSDHVNINNFFIQIKNFSEGLLQDVNINHSKWLSLKKFIQIVSLVFPISNLLISYYFDNKVASQIWNVPYFTYPVAAFLAAPNFALDLYGTTGAAGEIVDVASGRYTGGINNKRCFRSLMLLTCFVIAAFSAFVDAFIVEDNLSKEENIFYSSLSIYLAITLFATNTMFEGFTSTITYNNILQNIGLFCFNPVNKQKVFMADKLSRLSDTLQNSKQELSNWASQNRSSIEEEVEQAESPVPEEETAALDPMPRSLLK